MQLLYPVTMDYLRLFIALPLPDAIKASLHTCQSQLKEHLDNPSIRWIPPEQWHITLVFLGTVASEKRPLIEFAMAQAMHKSKAFELAISHLGTFPSLQRPSVLWLGLEGQTEKLQQLHHRLRQHLSTLFRSEERSFKAHITLARLKQSGMGKEVMKAIAATPAPQQSWQTTEIRLYSSLLKPSGSEYTALHQVNFE